MVYIFFLPEKGLINNNYLIHMIDFVYFIDSYTINYYLILWDIYQGLKLTWNWIKYYIVEHNCYKNIKFNYIIIFHLIIS